MQDDEGDGDEGGVRRACSANSDKVRGLGPAEGHRKLYRGSRYKIMNIKQSHDLF